MPYRDRLADDPHRQGWRTSSSAPSVPQGEARWVTVYEDDHEKEISQSDGETMKEVIINAASTLVNTVINLKTPSEVFGSEKTSTVSRARMTRGRVREQTFLRIPFRFPRKENKVTCRRT